MEHHSVITKTNGFPYSLISKLSTQMIWKPSLPPSHNNTPSNPKKWVTFTYYNSVIKILHIFSRIPTSKSHSAQVIQSMIYLKLKQIIPIYIHAQWHLPITMPYLSPFLHWSNWLMFRTDINNVSDTSPPVSPLQHMHSTFSTANMNTDAWMSPCP